MTWAIIWLVIEFATAAIFWDAWQGWKGWAFELGMLFAIITQLYTIYDIHKRTLATNKMLKDLLDDSADAMEDSHREPGDNSPYDRYLKPGVMRPIDQETFKQPRWYSEAFKQWHNPKNSGE